VGAELITLSNNVFMVIVTGTLTESELTKVQQEATEAMTKLERIRFVVVAEDFRGWQKGDDWSDLTFQFENDGKIERMALVGDRKWKELVLAFVGQGFRDFPIEYFESGQMAKARTWVLGK